MESNDLIYDFNFKPGDRAQYTYIDLLGNEKNLIVRILDCKTYQNGKNYIVSAHQQLLKNAGLTEDTALSNYYFNDLQDKHKIALIDPDELNPYYSQFTVIVDNTRGKK